MSVGFSPQNYKPSAITSFWEKQIELSKYRCNFWNQTRGSPLCALGGTMPCPKMMDPKCSQRSHTEHRQPNPPPRLAWLCFCLAFWQQREAAASAPLQQVEARPSGAVCTVCTENAAIWDGLLMCTLNVVSVSCSLPSLLAGLCLSCKRRLNRCPQTWCPRAPASPQDHAALWAAPHSILSNPVCHSRSLLRTH